MKKLFTALSIMGLLVGSYSAWAKPKETDRQIYEQTRQLLSNPGFENGITQWTASGSSVLALETTSPGVGRVSGKWDASATGEFLTGELVALPEILKGKQCIVIMQYKSASLVAGDVKLQAWDGTNILAEGDLNPAAQWTQAFVIYTCPTTGSVAPRLASTANAEEVEVDAFHVGQSTKEVSVASSEFMGSITFENDCAFVFPNPASRTDYVNTQSDASCTTTTKGVVSAISGTVYGLVMSRMPPGNYFFTMHNSVLQSSAEAGDGCHGRFRRADTDEKFAYHTFEHNGVNDNTSGQTVVGELLATTGATNVTINYQGHNDDTATQTHVCTIQQIIQTATDKPETTISVYRYPLDSEKAILLSEANGWHIDVNIGGDNANIGTATISTYTDINSATLDMVINSGSASAEIPCETTNPSTGLTCAAGDESIGVVFTPPFAGKYQVCVEVTHNFSIPNGTGAQTTFQLIETPNNAQTIVQEGNSRVMHRLNNPPTQTLNAAETLNICGLFEFVSATQRTIRLMFEQVVSGSISTSNILMDREASLGQRDAHFTVRPWTQNFPFPMILDSIVSANTGTQLNMKTAFVGFSAGVPEVTRQDGTWIDSFTDDGVGLITLNLTSGTFTSLPNCVATNTGTDRLIGMNVVAANEIDMFINVASTDTAVDQPFYIVCTATH